MPELPEVENIKRGLEAGLKDKKIVSVSVFDNRLIVPPDSDFFKKKLLGHTFKSFDRHGKYLKISLAPDNRWVVHLRMTGQVMIASDDYTKDRHVHLELVLDNGKRLIYRDVRKFGRWTYVPEIHPWESVIHAGPDALEITQHELKNKMERYPNRKLKAFLLDQTILSGIGNIYADEIGFYLKVDPEIPVKQVPSGLLYEAMNVILDYAIKHNGTTFSDYIGTGGEKGRFQNMLNVYGRQKCRVCGHEIIKRKIAGRTTHSCPKCQGAAGLPDER